MKTHSLRIFPLLLLIALFLTSCSSNDATMAPRIAPTTAALIPTTAPGKPAVLPSSPTVEPTTEDVKPSATLLPTPTTEVPPTETSLPPTATKAAPSETPLPAVPTVAIVPFERTLSLQIPRLSGPDVLALQQQLSGLGYDVGVPDGVFGPLTDTAVRLFQQAENLVVDGIVGPQTWKVLFDIVPAPQPTPVLSGFNILTLDFPGASSEGIAYEDGRLWMTQLNNYIRLVNVKAPSVGSRVTLDNSTSAILAAKNLLWVAHASAGMLSVVDPGSREVVATVRVGGNPNALAYDGKIIWVAAVDRLVAVDAEDYEVRGTYETGYSVLNMVYDGSLLWIADRVGVYAYDINKREVRLSLPVGQIGGVYFDGALVWFSNYNDDYINNVDPIEMIANVPIPVARGPKEITSDGQRLWVMTWNGVQPVDPVSRQAGEFYDLKSVMMNIAFDGSRVWLSSTSDWMQYIMVKP